MKPSYGSEWDRGEHFWSDIFGLELTVMNDFDMLKEVNTLFFLYQRKLLVMQKSFWNEPARATKRKLFKTEKKRLWNTKPWHASYRSLLKCHKHFFLQRGQSSSNAFREQLYCQWRFRLDVTIRLFFLYHKRWNYSFLIIFPSLWTLEVGKDVPEVPTLSM